MDEKKLTVHTDERTVPIEFSDTGDFGVTKEELKFIIRRQLAKKATGRQKQRLLFGSVLKSMKKRPHANGREAMLKVFMEVLREMKNAGEVEFRSGKTAVFVVLA
jgi:hypothetical protein